MSVYIYIYIYICWDRAETFNHLRSEYSKLEQREYECMSDWLGKLVHWELCKRLKFDNAIKWYMHKSEFVRENETHKTNWDFEIQTNHITSTRKPRVNQQEEKNLSSRRYCSDSGPWSENKRQQKDKQLQFKQIESWENCRTWRWRWYQL